MPLCPPHMPQHTALGLGQLWTSVQGSRGPCAHGTGPARRPSPGLRTADHTRQHRTRWGREHPGGRCCTDGSGHGGASSPGVWLPLEAGSSRDQPGLHCGLALGDPFQTLATRLYDANLWSLVQQPQEMLTLASRTLMGTGNAEGPALGHTGLPWHVAQDAVISELGSRQGSAQEGPCSQDLKEEMTRLRGSGDSLLGWAPGWEGPRGGTGRCSGSRTGLRSLCRVLCRDQGSKAPAGSCCDNQACGRKGLPTWRCQLCGMGVGVPAGGL